jgi:Cu2+-exporting ATPase
MFCEGDKTYPENVGCPVCGMDLVKITGNDDESEDDTYKNLKKNFGFLWLLRFIFILSMGGMFFKFPFSRNFRDFTIDFHASVVFFTGWFLFKELGFLLNLGISICFH